MKNFRKVLMVFAISFISISMFAQGPYISFNAGYGMGTSTMSLDNYGFTNYTSNPDSYTQEQIFLSLGEGININGAFGLMFNENLGAEIGVSYLMGSETEAKDVYSSGDGLTTYAISSNMLRVSPSLVFSANMGGFKPYAKFGMLIGKGTIEFKYEDNDPSGDEYIRHAEFGGGLALGLNAGVGALFSLSDNMAIFGEISMDNMTYAPTEGEVTKATYNGEDQLGDMTTSQKEIEFVDSYTYDYSNPPSDSEPSQELKHKFPYGKIGFNFGIRLGF